MKHGFQSKTRHAEEETIVSQIEEAESAGSSVKVLANPRQQLIIIITTIFFNGAVVIWLLGKLSVSIYEKALLAPLLLTVMSLPILYFLILKRLKLHLDEFKRVENRLREKETFLKTIIETAPECIKLVSSDGTLQTMNRAGLDMIEADSLDQVKGEPISSLINSEDRPAFKSLTEDVFRGKAGRLEFEIVGKKGRHLILETHAAPLRNDNGDVVSLLGITRNITERKNTERALMESEEKYRSLVESTHDAIYLVDKDHKYVYINRKLAARMGFSGQEYVGRAFGEFHTSEETAAFIRDFERVLETGDPIRLEHQSRRDGRYFLLTMSPVKGGDGKPVAVTVVSKDITELKSLEEKLRTLSITDELTGLYNRRGFFTMADHILKVAKRQQKGLYMLYGDLDKLKSINDTWGHREGDQSLIDTAAILKATYRESDVIARIGGDEFAVIPVGTAGDNIENIVGRLQKNIENHNAARNRSYTLSMSSGISCFNPEEPCSLDELLAQGDKIMYRQKMLKGE
jgi:diguanylate cyclase (GGDEF)-like protein/PAS domain S-box-containing protein